MCVVKDLGLVQCAFLGMHVPQNIFPKTKSVHSFHSSIEINSIQYKYTIVVQDKYYFTLGNDVNSSYAKSKHHKHLQA